MGKTLLFKPKWFMGKDLGKEIRKMHIGRTLYFPCGKLHFGDVNADLDKSVRPDVIADLHKPPFKPRSFDTVFCDPPFRFYTDNRIGWKWIWKVAALARYRVIFKSPKINIMLKRALWKKTYYIIEHHRAHFTFLQVFDRKVHTLDEYKEVR